VREIALETIRPEKPGRRPPLDALNAFLENVNCCHQANALIEHRLRAIFRISPRKRRRIHEYLSFRAAVKTDAGTAAAAPTDESKVRVARHTGGTSVGFWLIFGNEMANTMTEAVSTPDGT
jgi:hypothetical protein